jgi:hypothetical protein
LPEKHALSWRKALFLGPHDDLRILSHARPIAPANPTSSVCCDVRCNNHVNGTHLQLVRDPVLDHFLAHVECDG